MRIIDFIDRLDYIFGMKKAQDRAIAICSIAGMTQKEIGNMLRVSQAYISKRIKRIEEGYKNI